MINEIPKEPLSINYYQDRDIVVINGVHYSGEIFRAFAIPRKDRFHTFDRTKELPETVTIHSFDTPEAAYHFIQTGEHL